MGRGGMVGGGEVRSLIKKTLNDGTTVEAARAFMSGGQVVGNGWLVVSIDENTWIDVSALWRSDYKLFREIEACDTIEEVRAFVLGGEE